MAVTRRLYLVIFSVIVVAVAAATLYLRHRAVQDATRRPAVPAAADCATPAPAPPPVTPPPKLPDFTLEPGCATAGTAPQPAAPKPPR